MGHLLIGRSHETGQSTCCYTDGIPAVDPCRSLHGIITVLRRFAPTADRLHRNAPFVHSIAKCGLSLAEAAERLGAKSRNVCARYERGDSSPTLEKLSELMAAVSPSGDFVLQRTADAGSSATARDMGLARQKAASGSYRP